MGRHYLQVAESVDSEPIRLPTATDGTLHLATLEAKFPGVSGLKFRDEESGHMEIVRLSKGRLHPPEVDGWGDYIYHCILNKVEDEDKKRKWDDDEDAADADAEESQKSKKVAGTSNGKGSSGRSSRCSDLIVLSLPWKTSDEELKKYFKDFGEVVLAKVNVDGKTGRSKGFGFIRFANLKSQIQVLNGKHLIGGRWCEVKIPNRTNFR